MAIKKKTAQPADEGFLTTAAQAIGSTLGQIAVKTGVVSAPSTARKKAKPKRTIAKKTAAIAKKKTATKKKAAVPKKKAPVKRK